MKLDIKTIVDLRGPAEYNKGAGERRLDSIYKQHIAKIPKFSGNFDDAVVFKSFSSSSQCELLQKPCERLLLMKDLCP